MKVIVADKISERGVELLKETGWKIVQTTKETLAGELADADALIVRSATKVTPELMDKAPKLRVVGAHLGSNEEDFQALAKRLDKYPNFSVDISARTARFFDGDLAMKRQFVEKYQDRLLYGSDHEGAGETDAQLAKAVLAQEDGQWNLFASKDKITNRKKEIQGMGLPEPILRKIFHSNAVRMFPGIAPA